MSFETLNNDTLRSVLAFVGENSYDGFGLINKNCHKIFRSSHLPRTCYGYAPLKLLIENSFFFHDSELFYRYVDEDSDEYDSDTSEEESDLSSVEQDIEDFQAMAKIIVQYSRYDILGWLLSKQNSVPGGLPGISHPDRGDLLEKEVIPEVPLILFAICCEAAEIDLEFLKEIYMNSSVKTNRYIQRNIHLIAERASEADKLEILLLLEDNGNV